jgi:hypothetical protein
MALFVIPYIPVKRSDDIRLTTLCSFIVVLGWILGKPLTLLFDSFLSVVLFLTGEMPFMVLL